MIGIIKQILGVTLPCTIFFSVGSYYTGTNTLIPRTGIYLSTTSEDLGSVSYCLRIQNQAAEFGPETALAAIMRDVEEHGGQIDKNNYEDNLRFYRLVSYYVGQVGTINEEIHYFRNKLNRAPATLSELLLENSSLPQSRRWKLLSVNASLYHMQGKDGIYNIKFISGDGFCEAVYNKRGVLLTEKNDPVNMGTFNYAPGIPQFRAHERFDISPYLKWGNTLNSPQKGTAAIEKGTTAAAGEYNKHIASVQHYRDKVTSVFIKKV